MRRWDWLLLAGWIAFLSIVRAGQIEDTDPYWQARAGIEVLNGTPLVRPDSWSWDPVPGLFYPNSPAWNIALGLSWSAIEFWGLFLLTALSLAGYMASMAWLARILGASPVAIVLTLLLLLLLVQPMLSARATLVAQTLFLVGIGLAFLASERIGGMRTWVAAALGMACSAALSLVGNWIHLSWSSFALVSAGAYAIIWFLSPGMPTTRAAAISLGTTLGMLLGIAAGPYGAQVWQQAQAVLEACRGLILEWTSPLHPSLVARWLPPTIVVAAVLVAASVLVARRFQRSRSSIAPLRLMVALTASSAPFVVASFAAIRFVGIAALTLAPVMAWGLGLSAARLRASARRSALPQRVLERIPEWTSQHYWRILLTATLVILTPLALVRATTHGRPPTQALNELLPSGCRLFSASNESAAVILTRPDVPIWLDGRADYWGRDRLLRMDSLVFRPDPIDPVPAGATCVLLPGPGVEPALGDLVRAVDANGDWERVAEDRGYVLWVREGVPWPK